jgi:hypothetical protein
MAIQTYHTIIVFLDIIHRLVFISTHNISEAAFRLSLQVEPNQLGPIDRASPYFRSSFHLK